MKNNIKVECDYCHAKFTHIISIDNPNKIKCPYCGWNMRLPKRTIKVNLSNHNMEYQEYKVEKMKDHPKLFPIPIKEKKIKKEDEIIKEAIEKLKEGEFISIPINHLRSHNMQKDFEVIKKIANILFKKKIDLKCAIREDKIVIYKPNTNQHES